MGGPSGLTDGKDIGHDLAGGWFDAGDHWTANLTMSFAAMTLAWSAVEQPEGWVNTGQMDELLESLIYVNQYFVKCVINPECADPAKNLEVAIGCGGREGVEPRNVHSMWAAAELAHLMTDRPTFRLNKQAPGGDVPAAMAAAMTTSAMVIRDHAAMLKSKRGYEKFDALAFSSTLLDRAEKLTLFAKANMGPVVQEKASEEEKGRDSQAAAAGHARRWQDCRNWLSLHARAAGVCRRHLARPRRACGSGARAMDRPRGGNL